MLMLPVQVVRHARSITFWFMAHHSEEGERWLDKIGKNFGYVGSVASARPSVL